MTIAPPRRPYAPDMPVSGLQTAEALLVVTLRLRVLWWREPDRHHLDWRTGLQASHLPPWAVEAFDGLFQTMAPAIRRPLDVRGLHCPHLGLDEGLFLQAIGHFQHCRSREAERRLRDWLPPAAGRLATHPAAVLACALQRADLVLPPRGVAVSIAGYRQGADPGPDWIQ